MDERFREMDELQIIQAAQSGDGEAMTYLLEKYKSMVRALSRPLFLMDGDKDDLLQEGMIGLFKAIRTYDADRGTAFETFANLCISSQLYSAIKISNRQKNIPLNSYISLDMSDGFEEGGDSFFELNRALTVWQQNPEEIVIGEENARNIKRRLYSRLSKMEMQVLSLFLKGLTYQEIAGKLGKSPKAIDNALQRIKIKLLKLQKRKP
ncbi:MAG TPA: RNA polymerase subunit sigma-70 [Lachnospiraceae bacterium]|nr:RNA polymerase subunit sigma-70 [Lachnospiraceae bacterium]